MEPTLVVLAAGIGSRYGGLKQMDGLGPSGETIVEYSVFDAIRAGFKKVVFVIRKDIEKDFRELYHDKLAPHIAIDYACQEMDMIPDGFTVPADRKKPWGTAHAVLVSENVVSEPFAVINADDFYGAEAYEVMYRFLSSLPKPDENHYCMVGYKLQNTLSDYGYVSRGLCTADENGYLKTVVEKTHIEKKDGKIICMNEDNSEEELTGNEIVSMNMWGFSTSYYTYANQMFRDFLSQNIEKPKAEFFIPIVANNLIQDGEVKLSVLSSDAQWFGVTYKEDRDGVVSKINALVEKGAYPDNLWRR